MAAQDLTAGTGIRMAQKPFETRCEIDCSITPVTNADGASVILIPPYHTVETVDVITTTLDTGGATTMGLGLTVGGTQYISAGNVGSGGTAGAVLSSGATRTVAGATAKYLYVQPSANLTNAVFTVVALMRDLRDASVAG